MRGVFVSVAAELCPAVADLCKALGVLLCNQPQNDGRATVTLLQTGRRSTRGPLQKVCRYGHIQATPAIFRLSNARRICRVHYALGSEFGMPHETKWDCGIKMQSCRRSCDGIVPILRKGPSMLLRSSCCLHSSCRSSQGCELSVQNKGPSFWIP